MRLTRADRELIDVCRQAIAESNNRPPRMAEVGSRSAEIASTLMAEFPKLHVDLCGDWNNFTDLPWQEQKRWSDMHDRAMSRTARTPERRRIYKCRPDLARSLIAQYSLTACCFSDDRVTTGWDVWYSRVASGGGICGVRSSATDESLSDWSKSHKVPAVFGHRIWWVRKPQ